MLPDESPERDYSCESIPCHANVEGYRTPIESIASMIAELEKQGGKLVAISEAECSIIGLMVDRVASELVHHLNKQEFNPLEALGYIGAVVPEDVLEIRDSNNLWRKPTRSTILAILKNKNHTASSVEEFRKTMLLIIEGDEYEATFTIPAKPCKVCEGEMIYLSSHEGRTGNPPQYQHRCLDCRNDEYQRRNRFNENT